ncbi:hypothetical protein SAMN04488564_11762 [Lentzea waywayandensis]|uniref:Uncharacterized protein n=1 Tax=Lentzea waywayandensis TaxID=84724 RepID=A0A1I6FGV3_9PSEU|nr:hypothetical protein SAMN04488564_11762 [Lentzea waywayandensis]
MALWLWGTGLFVSSTSVWLNGLLVMPPAWEAASWSLCVVVFAAVVPLLVDLMWHSPSYRLLSVGEWSVPVGAGLITYAVGCWDLAGVYDGLRPLGIAEHMAGSGRSGDAAWWGWLAVYPGDPIRSLVVGLVAVIVVVLWAWWRRRLELVAVVAVVVTVLLVAMAVRGDSGRTGVLTPLPYDADAFFWNHVAITLVAGAALTAGTVISCVVHVRTRRQSEHSS